MPATRVDLARRQRNQALRAGGPHVEPELVTGNSIPPVAVGAWFGIHHIRRGVMRPSDTET